MDILVLDMPLLDTRRDKNLLGTFIADLVLQVLSFVAQNERENIRRRQAEGIAAARRNGVRFGHKPKPLPPDFADIYALWKQRRISTTEAAKSQLHGPTRRSATARNHSAKIVHNAAIRCTWPPPVFFYFQHSFLDRKNSLVNVIGQSQTAEVSLAAKYT